MAREMQHKCCVEADDYLFIIFYHNAQHRRAFHADNILVIPTNVEESRRAEADKNMAAFHKCRRHLFHAYEVCISPFRLTH